jgi:hypothetical protein
MARGRVPRGLNQYTAAAGHLRAVLGEAAFEVLAREGAAMERAAAVRYAHEQIQRARDELEAAAEA